MDADEAEPVGDRNDFGVEDPNEFEPDGQNFQPVVVLFDSPIAGLVLVVGRLHLVVD